jgi:iron complex transport system ATP-binding protein
MSKNPYLSRLRGESKRDYEVALEAMKLTNTLYLAERPFNELSGEEKQCVIIARALAQEPKALSLDEPTSHFDINNQIEALELLKKLCKEKRILVVMVIHDFNLATYYCDKVILMKDGRIFAVDAPSEVLTPSNIEAVLGSRSSSRGTHLQACPSLPYCLSPRKLATSPKKRVHVVWGERPRRRS